MKKNKEPEENLFEALALIEKEKGIPADFMLAQISKAIVTACKNSYGGNDDVNVVYNEAKGRLEATLNKVVVEEVMDVNREISLTEAKKLKADVEIGDKVGIQLDPKNFGRIAVMTARNMIRQGIRDGEKEQEFIDLWFADMYFSMLWMATAKGNFAPRSAYFLDRRQKKSAGSLIIGGRLQRNIAEDNDGVLGYENDKRDITSIWGDVGYTYTFVFSNGYFWNLWGVVGIAYGREHANDGNLLLPESDIKTALGYIGEKWAWNIVLKSGYSAIAFGEHLEQKYVSAFEILVVRRF